MAHLLLQSFTSDRNLLLAAVHKAIPRFPPPDRGTYTETGYMTLQTIENDLAQYPGRKNILWFSGGSSLFLHADPLDPQVAPPKLYPNQALLRDIYDERFCRMWEFYLVASEVAFRRQDLMVFQIQLAKQVDAVPLTRDYMLDWERAHSAPADAVPPTV